MPKNNFKKLYLVIVSSILSSFVILLIFDKIWNFWPSLLAKKVCESYFMISYVILVALCYILDTNKGERNATLTIYLFPFLSLIFLVTNLLVKDVKLYQYIIVFIAIIIWLLLNYFVLKKILLYKINQSPRFSFWFYFLYYLIFLLIVIIASYYILN